MKSTPAQTSVGRRHLRALIALPFLTLAALAQVAPAPAPDGATLARYDKNRNDRLDPDEISAMEAGRTSPAPPRATR